MMISGDNETGESMLSEIWSGLLGPPEYLQRVSIRGEGGLQSDYPVTDLAAASVAAAGMAVSELARSGAEQVPSVSVDRRLSSMWFGNSIYPIGWKLAPMWDSVAGIYQCLDGFIRLHTNAPHHRTVAMQVLGVNDTPGNPANKHQVAELIAKYNKSELETLVVSAGGCAAALMTAVQWSTHPQGLAVAQEPLVARSSRHAVQSHNWQLNRRRPLQGVRVLDLTRVLAGPVATRFLAGLGANVLRIDPPDWDEPGVVPGVTLGKRCARLDLGQAEDRAVFEHLLAGADVLAHGYRPGALDSLGYDSARRQALKPDLVEVSINAYGWTGPWRERRGFDSLVQMSCGIADEQMRLQYASDPLPLPVQALDHSAGHLLAAAALRGLTERRQSGTGSTAQVSLARMAKLLMDNRSGYTEAQMAPVTDADFNSDREQTVWGPAHRLIPPLDIEGTTLKWTSPATALGSSAAIW